jgi:hypothetical protein
LRRTAGCASIELCCLLRTDQASASSPNREHDTRLLLRASSIDAEAWATRLVSPGDAEEERLKQWRTRRSTPALPLARYSSRLVAETSYARIGGGRGAGSWRRSTDRLCVAFAAQLRSGARAPRIRAVRRNQDEQRQRGDAQAVARSSSAARCREFAVSSAARSNSARASSGRPSFSSRSPRTMGSR